MKSDEMHLAYDSPTECLPAIALELETKSDAPACELDANPKGEMQFAKTPPPPSCQNAIDQNLNLKLF